MTDSSQYIVALGIGSPASLSLQSPDGVGAGPNGHVLRVALALRGGVSLAVWIGGAIAELDVARRVSLRRTSDGWDGFYTPPSGTDPPSLDAPEIARARVYARLLADAGLDAVEIDVLAGASAGGLNAVVYAVAQRAGASVNTLLETWQDAADIRQLLQPPGFGRVDSLLRGDYYFWPRVTRALHDLHTADDVPRNHGHRAPRVSIDLAATVIDSADRSVPGARDSRGYFHFVGDETDEGSEAGRGIPREIGDGVDLARLSYAARSTSSYPGAFEPALIFSKTKRPDERVEGDETHIDMSYAFSGHRPTWNHPFRVIDGSILDEVPIDQAFKAARRSASTTRSSRLVLYLDPSPLAPSPRTIRPTHYGPPEPARGPLSVLRRFSDRQSRILNVLRADSWSAEEREPGSEEIARIERFRLALLRESARGDAYAAARTAAGFDRDAATRAYVRYRASADVEHLSAVTTDPSAWQNSANLDSRSVWAPWDAGDREDLERVADDRYSRVADQPRLTSPGIRAIACGPQAALDAALCGLSWVRAIEQLPPALRRSDPPVADIRLRLYTVLGRATDLRDASTVRVLDAGEARPRIAQRAIDAWIEAQGNADVDALWRQLDDVVTMLRNASPPAEADETWAHSPFSAFPRKDAGARDLAPFLAPRGIPEPISSLTFDRLTADEPPAHPEQFAALIRRRQRRRARIALSLDPADVTDETTERLFHAPSLSSDDKLSGSLLFNFGGFLSRKWRANDWWWGRLDAAAAIVRILAERSTSSPSSRRAVPDDVDEVQSSLFAELAASDDAPLSDTAEKTRTTQEIRDAFEFGGDTLNNLAGPYRLAIASRSLRVASRALTRSVGPIGRVLVALARPFAVGLPAAAIPVRAALIGATVGLAAAVIAGLNGLIGPTELSMTWPAHVISAVIIAAACAGFINASKRWRHVIRRLHHVSIPLPRDTIPDMVMLRRSARAQGAVLCVLASVTAAAGSATVALRGLDATWWILSVAAAIVAGCSRARSLSPSPSPGRHYVLSISVFAAWAASVIAAPAVLGPLQLSHRWTTPVTVVLTGAVVSALLTVGWLRAAPTMRGLLANPLATSMLSALAGSAPVWIATRVTDTPFPTLTTLSTVVLAILLWGSVLWWLPELPPSTRDRFTDDDARRPSAP
ncbi:DUF3376 domain-containing protein [Paramicrobacterium agarici]|uniref:DUF3376 domain-containing protein n=1 Tax=Paramicrobacterium agarici TaxID=630514 RepID=UPI0011501DC1|nr:DUF3376 domain-containing protein [Microbacterium agarici]TQO24082.1 patatin-related protein [Microbacterium agarici]